MKKLLLVLLFTISIVLVYAQDESNAMYKNAFTFSPLKFTENTFQMGYERFVNKNNSLYFALGAIYKEDNDHEEGFLGEIHYRYRVYNSIGDNSKFSIFFSPYLQYKYVEISRSMVYYEDGMMIRSDDYLKVHSYGGGLLIGASVTIVKRLVFDFYLGGGMRRTNDYDSNDVYYDDNSIWDHTYNGIAPKLGFNVGFNF